MKNLLLTAILLASLHGTAQDFKRKAFDYKAMPEIAAVCTTVADEVIGKAFAALTENNSKNAVALSRVQYERDNTCPDIYETYGYSLFRSGEWLEGIAVIEAGLQKFGSVKSLIKRRSDMSLEMFELGIGAKSIDGNSVYKAKDGQLPYNEEQFKAENLESARIDLEFLNSLSDNAENTFYLGKIYQQQGKFEESNAALEKLTQSDSYDMAAQYNIADNYKRQKKYTEAEKKFLVMLETDPSHPELYNKLAELYDVMGNAAKKEEYERRGEFFATVPEITDLQYSDDNYALVDFFSGNKTANEKMQKLKNLKDAKNDAFTTDVCLMVLKLHANHGNGVEEYATEILAGIGKPALEKVHSLFMSDVSTCTITNLAEIMAKVKDERSWELMAEYLPYIANMPMTLIPPDLPQKMVDFDEKRGTMEILKVVKGLLNDENDVEGDPMAELTGFSQFVYYLPLKKLNQKKVFAMATELKYSESEIAKLKEKIE